MKLNNKVYDFFKWILMKLLPATVLLIESLGIIYNFDTSKIILTIGAITTFIATLTGISTYNYNKK